MKKNSTKEVGDIGDIMYQWAQDLFPICRSLTGPGVRYTLNYIKDLLPGLRIDSFSSGEKVFDWVIPEEWIIRDAYISNENGERVVDFQINNLHVVGYSEPVDQWFTLDELHEYLHSLPEQPDAIPYVTSYYERRWGFCLSDNQRKKLNAGRYHVVIDSDLAPGKMNYAELILPGTSSQEVLLSTYICHPSMANNELSGPVVTTSLAKWLMDLPERKYTYRIIFVPETIGAIAYISKNLHTLKKNTIAGFQITCVGDDRCYSYLPSRSGDSLSDHAALHVLKNLDPDFKSYSFLNRGSDERQYCAPGVDLPIASIMRSKYHEYPEYHTSLDNLDFITSQGLLGGYTALRKAIEVIEKNCIPKVTVLCEPQLGLRGLYPNLSSKINSDDKDIMMNFIAYCDGSKTILEIAEVIEVPVWELFIVYDLLNEQGLVEHKENI